MMNTEIKGFIQHTILNAGKILMEYFHNVHRIERKNGGGLVTEADKRSEDFVISAILREFPDHSILAEESGTHGVDQAHKWIIDPLDGTTNFANDIPWFCISIAYEHEGNIAIGAIYNPVMDELFLAEQTKGAYLNDKVIKTSKRTNLSDSLLATGFYYYKGPELDNAIQRFRKMKHHVLGIRRIGSASLDLAYTAAGRFDGYWEQGLSPWDIAAGVLIVKEAGGIISDFKGKECTIYDKEIMASNGLIHQRMVEVLNL